MRVLVPSLRIEGFFPSSAHAGAENTSRRTATRLPKRWLSPEPYRDGSLPGSPSVYRISRSRMSLVQGRRARASRWHSVNPLACSSNPASSRRAASLGSSMVLPWRNRRAGAL